VQEGVGVHLRHEISLRDVETIVARHGAVYAQEHGFDRTFETYVAGPLMEAYRRGGPRGRIWVAEDDSGRFLGCIAIVAAGRAEAQLRWYLVEPHARGKGLGTRLLDEAVSFARGRGYESIKLRTVSALTAAARRYRAAGFRRIGREPGRVWGVDVVEETWELPFGEHRGSGADPFRS
jgi:GNAT superfamily N-acetyltransferase